MTPAARYAAHHLRSDSAAWDGLHRAESRRLALQDVVTRFVAIVGPSDLPVGAKREAYFDMVEGLER
jgi:hypothetical protein